MPQLNGIEEETPRYAIISEGTEPSYRAHLWGAALNLSLRVALGYKNNRIVALDETNAGQFQPLENQAH